ncbi:hypothetical protein Vafri_1449 [Volvox africanus]|nr:hypothetical protein Vafri_1449 [Volvox africanus]
MAFLANKLTASKAVAASDTRVIGAAGTHRPAVGGETMEPEVCTGATPSGVGYGRGNGVQARKLAAGGADGVAVVEPVGKLHSLSLSLGQLAEAAAGTPGLGCSARIEGRGDEGAPQRGAVSQHRVFLALLNMAHQNNVAWQQEWQQQLEETMGGVAEKMKDPQRVALRGGGAAMSLGQQWMEGVMRLQSWQDGDVQVEVLPA